MKEGRKEGRPLSESLLKSIHHQQLLSFGRGASKPLGAYKHEQNHIGEHGSRKVSFVPIPPERRQDGMDALFRLIENANTPVLLRTALAYAEFAALAPCRRWKRPHGANAGDTDALAWQGHRRAIFVYQPRR